MFNIKKLKILTSFNVCFLSHLLSAILVSYNPYDGPNEHPEAELPLVAGKYLYVYGNMDDDGFYEGN